MRTLKILICLLVRIFENNKIRYIFVYILLISYLIAKEMKLVKVCIYCVKKVAFLDRKLISMMCVCVCVFMCVCVSFHMFR